MAFCIFMKPQLVTFPLKRVLICIFTGHWSWRITLRDIFVHFLVELQSKQVVSRKTSSQTDPRAPQIQNKGFFTTYNFKQSFLSMIKQQWWMEELEICYFTLNWIESIHLCENMLLTLLNQFAVPKMIQAGVTVGPVYQFAINVFPAS